jgi:UDP-N-acetylmuramoyl-L-alanyl-D-glutamate--2,6-diaminopimelate ligase
LSTPLKEILGVLENPILDGDPSVEISGVSHDSRKIRPGWIFVAMVGEKSDGHDFISQAINAGAAAMIAERSRGQEFERIPWVRVPDSRCALGPVAALLHGRPTAKMILVGITGTNGKTTLTFLLEAIVKAAGGKPGVIGTISHRWGDGTLTAVRTTPEASDLQLLFKEMVEAGVTHTFIEVSSHGLHRGRLLGCDFDLGVFTNLTQDHLDYHGNIEEYYLAKQMLFTKLLPSSSKKSAAAVVNLDDPYGRRLALETKPVPVLGYGSCANCQVRPTAVNMTAEGISATVDTPRGSVRFVSRLTGSFNLMNILAAIAVAEKLEIPSDDVRKGIEAVDAIPGRLERVLSTVGTVFVDYAHTPNAIKNVLEALRTIRTGRIITVMGCGGDRDRSKRPLMGKEAAAGSDFVIVTSDNPRTEDPIDIIKQVEEGVRSYGFKHCSEVLNGQMLNSGCYKVIPERRDAIAWAVKHLKDEDILLLAGKGHETYQEINGVRYPFDDREVLRDELSKHSLLERPSVESPLLVDDSDQPQPESGRTRQ